MSSDSAALPSRMRPFSGVYPGHARPGALKKGETRRSRRRRPASASTAAVVKFNTAKNAELIYDPNESPMHTIANRHRRRSHHKRQRRHSTTAVMPTTTTTRRTSITPPLSPSLSREKQHAHDSAKIERDLYAPSASSKHATGSKVKRDVYHMGDEVNDVASRYTPSQLAYSKRGARVLDDLAVVQKHERINHVLAEQIVSLRGARHISYRNGLRGSGGNPDHHFLPDVHTKAGGAPRPRTQYMASGNGRHYTLRASGIKQYAHRSSTDRNPRINAVRRRERHRLLHRRRDTPTRRSSSGSHRRYHRRHRRD
ncbi:MAG: hypothetical protein WC763_05815 [Candidatus Paceibacterota bacterium]|jgi:hypothetical protein